MSAFKDLTCKTFGDLYVVSLAGKSPSGEALWLCKCLCGKEKIILRGSLVSGKSKSCGCGVSRAGRLRQTTHGQNRTPLHKRWMSIRGRCSLNKKKLNRIYSGRGIKICERWNDFENFAADMGPTFREDLEIDRIDVNGDYCPGNCRWVSRSVNQRNKRNNHLIKIGEVTKTIAGWSDETGIKQHTIINRIRDGWPVSRLLKTTKRGDETLLYQPPT